MLLTIPEKYFLRWERYTKFGYGGSYAFVVRYVFSVPDKANTGEGYTFCFDTEDFEGNVYEPEQVGANEHYSGSYHIKVNDTAKFTAVKTEGREEGKKYKRYSFTALELQALYNGHDLEKAETVVAKIMIYANTHNRKAREVREEKIIVGQCVGCWLYTSESDTKRLIGSKGVEILGKISNSDKEAVEQEIANAASREKSLLEEANANRMDIYYVKEAIQNIKHIYTGDERVKRYLQVIEEHSLAALELLAEKKKIYGKQIDQVPGELLEGLKKFYKD